MAELYYIDAATGAGGFALIQGSAPGDTHTVWVSRYAGGIRNDLYQNAGTQAGDGQLPITLGPGPYHGFLQTINGGVQSFSAPIGFRVQDGMQAIHFRLALALKDFVLGLSIPGVPDSEDMHVVAKVGAKLEAVMREANANQKEAVYYIPVSESYTPHDNGFDSVQYPVVVILISKSGQRLYDGLQEILRWRQLMHANMGRCAQLGMPEIHSMDIRPGAVVDPNRWLENYDASVLTIIGNSERPHGLQ